jgi:hypothetical protein
MQQVSFCDVVDAVDKMVGEGWSLENAIRRLKIGGVFEFECYDKVHGNLKWRATAKNAVTTAGLNDILNRYLGSTAKATAFYVGLIRDDNYSALAAGDTMASHGGWEEGDEYDEWATGRAVLTVAGASGGVVTNTASKAEFTINGTETIQKVFLGWFRREPFLAILCLLMAINLFGPANLAIWLGITQPVPSPAKAVEALSATMVTKGDFQVEVTRRIELFAGIQAELRDIRNILMRAPWRNDQGSARREGPQ